MHLWDSLVAQLVKNLPAKGETWVWSLHWEDLLEEGMVTHPSILAWSIPTDRGAWLQSIGLQRVGHDLATKHIHWKDWCWSWSSNTLTTWCEELTHWTRPWYWEILRTGEGVTGDTWLDGIIKSMDMCLSKLQEILKDREACLGCCSPWGHQESDTVEWLNNNSNSMLFCKVRNVTYFP